MDGLTPRSNYRKNNSRTWGTVRMLVKAEVAHERHGKWGILSILYCPSYIQDLGKPGLGSLIGHKGH